MATKKTFQNRSGRLPHAPFVTRRSRIVLALLIMVFPISVISVKAQEKDHPDKNTASAKDLKEVEQNLDQTGNTLSQIRSRIREWQFEVSDQANAIASVKIFHQYRVSSGKYYLSFARYFLDSFEIYQEMSPKGHEMNEKPHAIYNGSILPGTHTLYVEMIYEPKPAWFFFQKSPALKVSGRYTFEVNEGEDIHINTVCYEEVSAIANYQKKLRVRFDKE